MIVAPESDTWRAIMGEGEIHPAVVIEIENGNASVPGEELPSTRSQGCVPRNFPSRGFSKIVRTA